ncbi:MAG TPA: recombination protein RecR [Alphaproteobacteria bacterium]|jgi:recombination protein RecR|nr:recombination protein RecR [Paracoccaceae bacterium]RCL80885.1 MAG: recombination protein RecR [SAR116 cluster bacterium]RPH13614.1 MAG: recombination protein RecR [Alphaproteobacteria bacterium TMED150]HBQ22237.1 recombination protein RecR [Alphaproteobacteria bacterium]HCY47661.1 recombination protein RecR [Alphaproteobacteria bacterium]|tara:strand:+ start:3466 stop:4071 length:606 start_codon:yes stop_codon:yes gene_type:complete
MQDQFQVAGELDRLIKILAKLPGLGPRSARRMALHMLTRRQEVLEPLLDAMNAVSETVGECPNCGNLDTRQPCSICVDERRQGHELCVVEHVADLWAMERSGAFQGRYLVLGGLMSALEGVGPDELRLNRLQTLLDGGAGELILALPATMEGQTTAHYIQDMVGNHAVRVTSLARGIPLGGELDYLDDGTLKLAFGSRQNL